MKTNDDFELMTVWKKHLEQNLDFPFESIVDEFQSKGPFKQGDRLNVFGIESVDDLYGVIISCKAGRRRCSFPLADLAAVDGKSDNADTFKTIVFGTTNSPYRCHIQSNLQLLCDNYLVR